MNIRKLQRSCEIKCLPRMIWNSANYDFMTGGKLIVKGTYVKSVHGRIGS